ncbi:hypothetical protein HU200_067766 [Digitaria exilis]|uniref:Uncharacterized protein n=1 Tax=Digitaria exilis TaxID=1010633 RepID=A0A834ZV34_9POAL|nr:hypothetical protein HU200_067766 [Digitaria exilis]CAB3486429.1 unnamed protein product [Digitaria exilis]
MKSPGVSQSSPVNEVGLLGKLSPIDMLEVVSPNALLTSRSQSPVAKLGIVADSSPTVSLNSTLTSTVEKSGFLAASSPCASVKSASPSDNKKSGIIPAILPSDRDSSFLLHNNAEGNGSNQITPTKLLRPDPPCQTQTPAVQAEDQKRSGAQAPVAKKPIDRLIAAVISSSPVVLHSSVNLIKSALREMDSVPLRTGSSNKIKRIYDVESPSESPTVSSMDGSTVTFEVDVSDSASSSRYGSVKRQKTQYTRVALLDEIEAVNSRLIDTVISITSDAREDGTTSCNGTTVVKLS